MADSYYQIQIDGLTNAQINGIVPVVHALDTSGISILFMLPNVPVRDALTIEYGGPSIAAFTTLLEDTVLSRLGRTVDISRSRTKAQSRVRTSGDIRNPRG